MTNHITEISTFQVNMAVLLTVPYLHIEQMQGSISIYLKSLTVLWIIFPLLLNLFGLHYLLGRFCTECLSELVHLRQLPAAAENEADEHGESKSNQWSCEDQNQNVDIFQHSENYFTNQSDCLWSTFSIWWKMLRCPLSWQNLQSGDNYFDVLHNQQHFSLYMY